MTAVGLILNTASQFTIRELTGRARTLILRGRGLPYRPFTLRGKQRISLDWYPGNPQATANVLGPEEQSTTINGMWKDIFIGVGGANAVTLNNVQVRSVKALVPIIDSMRREGQEVEVTWDATIRRGFIEEVEIKWQNIHDVEFQISFIWVSLGEATVPVTVATPFTVADVFHVFESMFFGIDGLLGLVFPPFPVSLAYLAAIDVPMKRIESAINTIAGANSNTANGVAPPADSVRRVISGCNSIIESTKDLDSIVASNPSGAINQAVALYNQDSTQRLQASQYTQGIYAQTRAIRSAAASRRAVFLKSIDSQLLAIYTARENDDLRSVSMHYYNTPYEWRMLMLFNNLTTSGLVPGQQLMVPKITNNNTSSTSVSGGV